MLIPINIPIAVLIGNKVIPTIIEPIVVPIMPIKNLLQFIIFVN